MAQPDELTEPHAAASVDVSPSRTIAVFAALGVLTGVLSYLAATYANPESLRFSFLPFGQERAAAPLLPGVIFGVLVAAACRHYGSKHTPMLALVVLLTTVAWILAYDITIKADSAIGDLRKTSDTIAAVSQSGAGAAERLRRLWHDLVPQIPLGGPISFGLGGFVGGFGTALAVATANARFRGARGWLFTLAVATFFGAIEKVYDLMGDFGLLVLFAVWQAAVIATIVHALGRQPVHPR
jgi:hypothetical protein